MCIQLYRGLCMCVAYDQIDEIFAFPFHRRSSTSPSVITNSKNICLRCEKKKCMLWFRVCSLLRINQIYGAEKEREMELKWSYITFFIIRRRFHLRIICAHNLHRFFSFFFFVFPLVRFEIVRKTIISQKICVSVCFL